jgi:type I restriction enzyme S subunit
MSSKISDLAIEVRDAYIPNKEDELPYIGLEHVEQGTLHISSIGLSQEVKSNKFRFKSGDILFGTLRPYFRKVIVTPCDGVCSTEFCVVRPKEPKDRDFVFYGMAHQQFIKYATANSKGARPRTKWKLFSDFKLPDFLPSQRCDIGKILSAYDDLIENNRRRIQLLEQAARLLYREWFVHLRFPGHEHVSITNGVPEGWEKTTVGSISSFISRGITPKYDDEAPGIVLNQKCIRNQRLDVGLARRQSKEVPLNKLVLHGDVLINSTGQGTLGRVAQFLSSIENCTVDSHVTIARPDKEVPMLLYGQHIVSMENYLATMGRGATNQTELSKDTVAELPFLHPSHFLAEEFETFAKETAGQVQNLMQQNTMLTQARDLLLPRLMNGEVTV